MCFLGSTCNCRFWLSGSRVGPETLHVQQASRWCQGCCSPDHCLSNELPYQAAQTLIHSAAHAWAPVRLLRAAWLAWTLKVMSADGCSAGFPPGERAQLAHLSEGEAKAIGPHLLWALRKATLNLAPQQPSCGETGFTDNCLQPQSGTGPSTRPVNNAVYAKWPGLGNCKKTPANHQQVGVGIFLLFFIF